jgi:chaperonin cofactor prefoldin
MLSDVRRTKDQLARHNERTEWYPLMFGMGVLERQISKTEEAVERLKKELNEEIAGEKTGKSNVIKCISSLLEVSTAL